MAVWTSDSDVLTESVRALYCSFILVSAPSRFALSSALRLSPLSASSSSTERIASEMPSRWVWRSFSTSCKQRENIGKSADHIIFNQYNLFIFFYYCCCDMQTKNCIFFFYSNSQIRHVFVEVEENYKTHTFNFFCFS